MTVPYYQPSFFSLSFRMQSILCSRRDPVPKIRVSIYWDGRVVDDTLFTFALDSCRAYNDKDKKENRIRIANCIKP